MSPWFSCSCRFCLLVTFTYLPFFKMVQFSFFSMRYIGRCTFVGLQNYIDVFTRDDIFHALIRNLFTIATLIPGIASQVTVYQIMTAL